jgi:kynurenine formamidase
MKTAYYLILCICIIQLLTSCNKKSISPQKVIDLSPTITEDMKVRLIGHAFLNDLGVRDSVVFEHLEGSEDLYFLDSYITLFNHAGPHADAPIHLIRGGATIDEYTLDLFYGKARYLDFSNKPSDSPITLEEIKAIKIDIGDIVILDIGFKVPNDPDELPAYAALSPEAAEYLAELPIKAYATDAPGVDNVQRIMKSFSEGKSKLEEWGPVHYAFLSREIPIIEGLCNLETLRGKEEIVFVGFPLKTTGKAGDGAPMRAAALIY